MFSAHAEGKNGSRLAAFRVADVRIIKIPALVLMEQLVFLHARWLGAIKGNDACRQDLLKIQQAPAFAPAVNSSERARESSRRRQQRESDFAKSNPKFLVQRLEKNNFIRSSTIAKSVSKSKRSS